MSGIDDRPGSELIIGRYRILYPLQEGGFGETFLVEDIHLPSQRRCVLKLLKPVHDNPEFYKLIKDRFQREAAIQETLGEACIHIPRLYAYFSDSDRFYLVEEWIDGETLTTKVAEVGRFSEVAVAEILSQLLLTIDTVHQHQIVHRDIKPDNIILRRRDGKPILIDFGAVKESMGTTLESQGASGRSIVIGTASYMAPEQSVGRPIYASDLYSLGLTAVYLLSGRSPGEMDHDPHTGKVEWRSQVPQVSEELAKIIETAIQTHPQDRYASAQDMFQALQMLQAGTLLEDIPTLISRPSSGNPSGQNAIPSTPGRQPSEPPVAQAQTPNFPVPNVPLPIPQAPIPQAPIPQAPIPYSTPQSQPQYQNLQQNLPPTPQQNSQPPTAQDPPQSSNSADLQTIVTSRNESLMNTQVVSPGVPLSNVQSNSNRNRNSSNAPSQQIPSPSGNRDWLKAALIGGGVGGGLLLGALLLRGQPSGVVVTPTPTASPSVVTSVSPSVSPSPSGSESPQPSKEASPEPADTAKDTCGDVSGSGEWYPVFINNAEVRQVRRKYCRDAIAKTRDNGTPAVQVASFTDRQRAVDFAEGVGGEVGEPYKVASSKPSSNPTETPSKPETPPKKNETPPQKTEPNSPKTGDTNAVIIGDSSSKNIRRGPGSEFPVQHIAYPGDRVQITGSEQDSGGYVWYKVYFPKSGASGWIAGQLIQPD